MPKSNCPVPYQEVVRLFEFIIKQVTLGPYGSYFKEITIGGQQIETGYNRPFEYKLARAYMRNAFWEVTFDLPRNYPDHYYKDHQTHIFNVEFEGDTNVFESVIVFSKMLLQ